MKNMLKHISSGLLTLLVLVGATSCLEKYPRQAIPEDEAMQTFNDAEQHLIGIYASLKSSYLFSGHLTVLPDIQTDLVYAAEGNSNTFGDFWQWKVRSTSAEIEAVYGALYSVIGNCNFYLDCIDEVRRNTTDDDALSDLDAYTGEVHAIRALCYSKLIECFCKAYDPATASDELGVRLRTKYFEPEPVRRASLFDSYKLVLDDLARAEELLPDEDDENVANSAFFTLAAAQALHARVALYMQDWDTAIEYSSKVIDDWDFTLASARTQYLSDGTTYFDYMWFYDASPEVIWRIGFTATSYGGALGTVFLNFTRDYTYFYPDYVPAQWALNAYDSNDLRKAAYFGDASNGIVIGYSNGMQWPLLVKYYGNRNLIQNRIFHVSMPKPFRLAEQYLIRAEAYCRTAAPNFSAAAKDLTTLRQSRFQAGGAVNLAQDNWQTLISEERMRELYMEGFRLHDLKRWNMGFERTPQSYAQTEGSSLKVEAGDPLFVWPIPQHEIEAPGSELLPNDSNH